MAAHGGAGGGREERIEQVIEQADLAINPDDDPEPWTEYDAIEGFMWWLTLNVERSKLLDLVQKAEHAKTIHPHNQDTVIFHYFIETASEVLNKEDANYDRRRTNQARGAE